MATLKNWQKSREELEGKGVRLPQCDVDALCKAGADQPVWMHFGGGNLYRAFHAQIAQDLADKGLLTRGVVVAETFRPFTISTRSTPPTTTTSCRSS